MSVGELSFESPTSVRVTWTIPEFFRVAAESRYSLRSPDFTFADGRHCLRLFQTHDEGHGFIGIDLLNSIDTDPDAAVLYEVGLKSEGRNEEIGFHREVNNKKVFRFYRRNLQSGRDLYVPNGTMTVLCYVRPREPDRAGSTESGGARARVIPEYRMTGNLSFESFPFLYVTWRIPEFFRLARGTEYLLESPEFPFSDRRCRLRVFQLGDRNYVQLVNTNDTALGRYVSYEVGLKSLTGEEINRKWGGTSTAPDFSILRSELDAMRLPDCLLTVYCSMRSREASIAGSPKSGGAETPGSKSFAGRTSNEEQDKEAAPDISKLLSDLRQLLQKMPDSDACLVVSGKEFRAHQIILRARSKVFDTMFGHETAERDSGRVVIDDLDPDSFGHFLEYLYTGSVGAGLSDDNAFGLYEAADKYDVPALKAKCVAHMRGSLSVDSFCDVLAVALQHSEEELLSAAALFFKENVARIVVTAKWQQFVIDNGKSANELFIQAFGPPGQ